MRNFLVIIFLLLIAPTMFFTSCGGDKPELFQPGVIADDEFDPAVWGRFFPLHYESWQKTKDPKPAGKSIYKKGWDTDKVVYDKLSEMPYLAMLFKGWGFGVEFNEPRGHHYAIIDQLEIDPSRVGPGGVCLACKSSLHKSFTEKKGMEYLTAKFTDAVNMYPEKMRKLGPVCMDCHTPSDMSLRTNKLHLENGLKSIGKKDPTRQEMRTLACAQCHITYYVPRDENKKVVGDVELAWKGGKWGAISIEVIIKNLLSGHRTKEWTQKVTGFDMPFVRHPEFELFTNGSVHANAGLSCADCHMPYQRKGSYKISTHDVTSPLKQDFVACAQCHTEEADWLRKQVFTIQERTVSLLTRAGYATATAARLFEITHENQKKGVSVDEAMYKKAKESYMNAFLRLNFVAAENSMGFHNSTEASRVLADSLAFANKTESLLRQALAKGGVIVPEKINLNLKQYTENRGIHKLNFVPDQEYKDPFGTQDYFTPKDVKGL
ncbi:MAG: ammonia-forming cytochrome c nitrite reductase subunit c552 [Spirochaetota bacterium]